MIFFGKLLGYAMIGFLLLISMNFLSCKKEEKVEEDELIVHEKIKSSFLISANIDSTFCNFDFSYLHPDTLTSVYYVSYKDLIIERHTSGEFNSNTDSSISIYANNFDLDNISYPITFSPKDHLFLTNPTDSSGLIVFLKIPLKTFSRSQYDSTLFTITFDSFVNDTLSGTFQGVLFSTTPNLDSVRNISNGEFKILLTRK